MKKKLKLILLLGCLVFLFTGVSCAKDGKIEEYQKQGYKVSVIYDANGGSFLNRPGVTIMDMFKPADYQADSEGKIHIKLTEPTDPSRPTSGSDTISLTLPNYFFAGWYQTRTVKTVDGVPVDKDGKALKQLEDGSYVYLEGENSTSVTPAYEYSDYWDFENDTIDYDVSNDELLSITLYAGWVEYFEFNYYYKIDGVDNSTWTAIDTKTSFDYKTTNAVGSTTSDKDTIFLPEWSNGAMNYSHNYLNHEIYNFPKIEGTTFYKAYEDAECNVEINGSLEHKGTVDLETANPINRVQNVYVLLQQGERYQITEASQIANNANLKGIYEIQADLDFTDISWPSTFIYGNFEGQFYGKDGHAYKLSNINANYNSGSARTGGLFGQISKGATIKDLVFEDVTFNLVYTGERQRNREFGLFAGNISSEATVSNVTVGGLMRIGAITLGGDRSINLLANGSIEGITNTGIALQIYGLERKAGEVVKYQYTINPNEVTIVDGEVVFEFSNETLLLDNDKFEINLG